MHITEKNYIDRCKVLIESKLNWQDSQDWKQRDYEYLCELIFETTKILLSLSTVKRLWNKDYEGTPHQSTLDALAKFLDFKNWLDFKKNQIEVIKQEYATDTKVETAAQKFSQKRSNFYLKIVNGDSPIYRYRALIIILLCIVSAALFFFTALHSFKSPTNYNTAIFTSKKVVTSGLPNTVIFNYDISMIQSDSVFIQQSWNTKRRAHITTDKQHHTSVYYYPGFHKAKLVVDDEVIKQHNIHVTTDGWLGIVRYKLNDAIPFYIPQKDIVKKGKLYVSPTTLESNKINLSKNEYIVSYFNVRDFNNLDGDNFVLETRLKNNLEEGGLTGQYSGVIIMCENGRMIIPLTIPGLVGNASVKFIDVWVHGRENDLSAFGSDLSNWNDLRCEVKDRFVRILLNGKLIHELSYQKTAGRIIGLHFMFYGCGSVNYVRLYDSKHQIAFEDEFTK